MEKSIQIEKMHNLNNIAGQTLIEVAVALAAAVAIVSAITITVISSLNNAQFSKNQNLATQYAEEGIEIIRRMKNDDWTSFNVLSGDYCFASRCEELSSGDSLCWEKPLITGCGENFNSFIREVKVEGPSLNFCNPATPVPPAPTYPLTNARKVTVTVKWSDSKCVGADVYCHKTESVSCFGSP